VQVAFARSVEPIMPLEISITRMAATNPAEKEARDKAPGDDERTENRTMGRKHIVPYGLYRAHIFVNAKLAERTGFTQTDLDLLFEALTSMFEHDRSAARGEMSSRKIVVFKHASALGNAAAHDLFDRVTVQRKFGDDLYDLGSNRLDNLPPARRFADYSVSIDRDGLPKGIDVLELIEGGGHDGGDRPRRADPDLGTSARRLLHAPAGADPYRAAVRGEPLQRAEYCMRSRMNRACAARRDFAASPRCRSPRSG
jgi:hypothetical protein